MNFNRFQTAVLGCFHRERLSLDLLSLWSWKAQLSKQPLFATGAPPHRRCRRAQPFGSLFYQPSQRPKEFVCRGLGKTQFSKQPFLLTPTPLPPPLPSPLLKSLATPPPLVAFLSVSAVSKTQRGCLAQPRIPSSESSLVIYFLEFLLKFRYPEKATKI